MYRAQKMASCINIDKNQHIRNKMLSNTTACLFLKPSQPCLRRFVIIFTNESHIKDHIGTTTGNYPATV